MNVENKNIGIHNQAVTATVQQERHDGNIETAGDVRRKYLAGSIAKLYLAAAAFAISREGNFDLEDRRHITLIRVSHFPSSWLVQDLILDALRLPE